MNQKNLLLREAYNLLTNLVNEKIIGGFEVQLLRARIAKNLGYIVRLDQDLPNTQTTTV